MRKGKLKAMALLAGAFFLLLPGVTARAETQEEAQIGAQTIVYEGEVYDLYKVETLPSAEAFAMESDDGLRTVREGTLYYYRSARAENIVNGEFTNDTYSEDGTLLATLKQTTSWHFFAGYYNKAPELLSADTVITYQHPNVQVQITKTSTTVPGLQSVLTTIHEVFYTVFYKGAMYEEEIYTKCNVFGIVS